MSSFNIRLLVFVILGGVLFGSCDQYPTEPARDDQITFSQRPIVYPGDDADEELAKSNQPQGRYYCLVGTLNPEGTEWAYSYRAFNVNLPPGLASKAQQSPEHDKWLRIRLGNRNATGRSEADVMPEGGVSVRTVRCNLPPLTEVTALVREKLREFSPQSWVGQHPDRASGAGESQPKAAGQPQQSDVVCVEYEVIEYCPNPEDNVSGDGIDPGCYMAGIIGCNEYAFVEDTEEEPNNGTGGGSSGSGGDSGDMCQPSDGDSGFTGVDGGVPLSCKEEDPCKTSVNDLQNALDIVNQENSEVVVEFTNEYGEQFGIDNEHALQSFMAQAAHESARYDDFTENTTSERARRLYGYSDILGNKYDGDGYKYRGRGILQLTGRYIYKEFTDFYQDEFDSNLDFVENPGLIASKPKIAVISALWFFQRRVINQGGINFDGNSSNYRVSQLINGSGSREPNGWADRKKLFNKLKEVIKDCNK